MNYRFAFCLLVTISSPVTVRAEFPGLEEALANQIDEAVAQIGKEPVWVLARNTTGFAPPWSLTAAIQTECVAGLSSAGKRTYDVGNNTIMDTLMAGEKPFNNRDLKVIQRSTETGFLLVAEFKKIGNSPAMLLRLLNIADGKELWTSEKTIDPKALTIESNIPELNTKVLAYIQQNMGKRVGSGNSWAFVAEALKAVGAKRSGTYHFGRLLGPNEAWVPGDMLQFERVQFRERKGKRRSNMLHHSAIVNKILASGEVEIVHQAFNGKDISTYRIEARELRDGRILAFRPHTGEFELPEPIPGRTSTPKPVDRSDGSIDLLKTLDPNLDFVAGFWHRFEGPLKPVKSSFSRIQIPFDLPESYTLDLRVRKTFGADTFGIGIVVDGHQTMIAIDSYGGKFTGIHQLGRKNANANETTRKVTVFTENEWVDIKCQVTKNSITLTTNGTVQFQWRGDPKQLSNSPKFKVPNENWLFLAAHNSIYEIAKITLVSSD